MQKDGGMGSVGIVILGSLNYLLDCSTQRGENNGVPSVETMNDTDEPESESDSQEIGSAQGGQKSSRKPTKPIQIVCPAKMVAEMRAVCELNCMPMARFISIAMRNLFQHLRARSQENLQKAVASATDSYVTLPPPPEVPDVTVKQAVAVRLPGDMWAKELQDEVLSAAEEWEDDPYADE